MFSPGSKDPESRSYPITLSPHVHQCSSTVWRSVVEWLGCLAQDQWIPSTGRTRSLYRLGCLAQDQWLPSTGRTRSLYLHMFTSAARLWRSVVEWLGRSAQDQRIPGSSPGRTRSLYLHMFTSAARLVYQRLSGVWIVCDSDPLRSTEKSSGIPSPGLPILAEVRITGSQWRPTAVMLIECNAELLLTSSFFA
jgi:hypothetical protein